jgi:hypothetical protein
MINNNKAFQKKPFKFAQKKADLSISRPGPHAAMNQLTSLLLSGILVAAIQIVQVHLPCLTTKDIIKCHRHVLQSRLRDATTPFQ